MNVLISNYINHFLIVCVVESVGFVELWSFNVWRQEAGLDAAYESAAGMFFATFRLFVRPGEGM